MSDYRGLIEEMEADRARPSEEKVATEAALQSLEHERLVAFLYLIMRDELPTGTVCKTITDITENDATGFQFTSPHLEALARDYANRIREG